MVVRLLKQWQRLPVGHTMVVGDGVANILIDRIKVAEEVKDDSSKKSKPNNRPSKRTRNNGRSKKASGTTLNGFDS